MKGQKSYEWRGVEKRKVGPVNKVNHSSLINVVTQTDHDRAKSISNICVIERFVLSLCFLILVLWILT